MASGTKIPVLGISNAGKTSLIKTLQREFKALSKLKPTKGIERSNLSFLDRKVVVWDFGGQDKYRKQYKKKSNAYFSGIKDLFYVVDIQDQDSFNESIMYFTEISNSVKENSPEAIFNIIIHKIDPGMEQSEDVRKLYQAFSNKLMEIAEPSQARLHQTSIFNPISVIIAFSKPIFGNTTLYDNFSFLFMEKVNSTPLDFITVFSSDLLEIGNYFDEQVSQQTLSDISNEIFKTFENKKLKLDEISFQIGSTMVHMNMFEAGGKKFYFTYGFDVTVDDQSSIQMEAFNLLEDVKKFMKYF